MQCRISTVSVGDPAGCATLNGFLAGHAERSVVIST